MDVGVIAKKYSAIVLNGEEISDKTVAMKLKNRCILAAVFLDGWLDGVFTSKDKGQEYSLIQEKINTDGQDWTLSEWMDHIADVSQRFCDEIAKKVKIQIMEEGLLEEMPSLLECDYNYVSAGINIKQYRADCSFYIRAVDSVKAEALEEGNISDETISIVWLLKQSMDLPQIFSEIEREEVDKKMLNFRKENEFARFVLNVSIGKSALSMMKKVLETKQKLGETPFGIGIVSKMPVLERKESIFIATEKMFSNQVKRVIDVKDLLEEKGHICEVEKVDGVSLMKIDNILYELVPDAIRVRYFNIHGVRLRKYVL